MMMRTLVAASVLSLVIGVGPALAQATPLLNPPPSEPGDMTKKKAVKHAKTSKTKKSSSKM